MRLGRFEHGVNQRVVADVRPGVVHVEDGDVDAVAVRRRLGIRHADVFEEIVRLVDVASWHGSRQMTPCSVSLMM